MRPWAFPSTTMPSLVGVHNPAQQSPESGQNHSPRSLSLRNTLVFRKEEHGRWFFPRIRAVHPRSRPSSLSPRCALHRHHRMCLCETLTGRTRWEHPFEEVPSPSPATAGSASQPTLSLDASLSESSTSHSMADMVVRDSPPRGPKGRGSFTLA